MLIQMHMHGLKGSQLRVNGVVVKSYLANEVRPETFGSYLLSGHNIATLKQLI